MAGSARLGNELKFQARLGLGLKINLISELRLAWARKEVGDPGYARFGFGQITGFELG